MEKFDKVFLHYDSEIAEMITIRDKCAIQYFRARKKLRSL